MSRLPEIFVAALAPASLYALIGVGFVLIYKATRVINFLQGQLAFVGALIFVTAYSHLDHQFVAATAVAVGAALLIGAGLYLVAIRPLTGEGVLIMIMLTLVLGTAVLNGVIAMIWPIQQRTIPVPLDKHAFNLIGGAYITPVEVATIVVAVVVIGGLALVLRYARLGIQMRAAAENPSLAGYRGVNVVFTAAISWGIATAAAFLGGIGYGTSGFDVSMTAVGLFAFPALLIGGMDSLIGVLVGAYILALVQQFAAAFLDSEWRDVSAFILLLVILMVRPYGFFGTREYRRL
jgi:branched-chain amino acid transport system permease protein